MPPEESSSSSSSSVSEMMEARPRTKKVEMPGLVRMQYDIKMIMKTETSISA